VFLFVTHKYATINEQIHLLKKLKETKVPVFVVLNKADETKPEEVQMLHDLYKKELPNAEFRMVSALQKVMTKELFSEMKGLIPEHPPYYPKDEITDRNVRFFITEIIREKILKNYSKEIPYSVEVIVEEYKDEPTIAKIRAVIYVERDSQKNIIIGKNGTCIQKVGTEARIDIENFIGGKKVFLDLFVKVLDNWRNNDTMLKRFGYK
jgi:GTP-binding protein Era